MQIWSFRGSGEPAWVNAPLLSAPVCLGPDPRIAGSTPLKAHLSQIERIDKHVDHANRIALVNEIIEAFGQ